MKSGLHGLLAGPLWGLLLFGLSACAPVPIKSHDDVATRQLALQHQQQVSAYREWKLFGRINASDGEQHWSGNLYWKQQGEGYLLRFSGPLGQGAFQIKGDDHQVTLTDSRRQSISAATPRALLAKVKAPELPVRGMVYWSRGLPVPQLEDGQQEKVWGTHKPAQILYDELARPLQIKQLGWDITYGDYQAVGKLSMPGRIKMHRDNWSFELSISKWTLK